MHTHDFYNGVFYYEPESVTQRIYQRIIFSGNVCHL